MTVPGGLVVAGYVDRPVELFDESAGKWTELPLRSAVRRPPSPFRSGMFEFPCLTRDRAPGRMHSRRQAMALVTVRG